jgi:lysophospholipase L1-like esterase
MPQSKKISTRLLAKAGGRITMAASRGAPLGEKMNTAIRLKATDTLVFIGDSITDAERHRQTYKPLGFGYVHFAGNLLWAKHPELSLSIVNTGVSGDTIGDMAHRWESDCIAHRPNVVSVLIGINDVWQLAMEPALAETAATGSDYKVTYDELLSRTRQRCDCQFILMEPFLFCRDQDNNVLRALRPYIEVVHRLAAKYDALLVPLQQEIDRWIVEIPPEKWSADMVHPYLWAHAWIALRWLEATGL